MIIIIVIIVEAAAVGGGRCVFYRGQTIRATCDGGGEHGYPPRVYFSRMPRRLANVKNRFPGVKINTPPNERAATEQSSPTAAHAEHTTTTWHRIGHDVAVAALERVVGVYWFVG